MKKIIFISLICVTGLMLKAQTTVTFKPDATLGKDAIIFTRIGYNDANTNFGNYLELDVITWTWDGNLGTVRSLIKFEQLSSIPSNAFIIDVKLKFYGLSSSLIAMQGNNYYPGSPYISYPNPVIVKRITSAWNENTVTWNTQPATTTANQMSITASTSQWNWNYTINNTPELRNIVQDMINNPSSNHGFMLELATEQRYRCMLFASSDHPNPALWPELIVTYTVCDADFSYCINSVSQQLDYTFTSLNPNNPYHQWRIDGQFVSTNSSIIHNLSPGMHQVCYMTATKEDKCEKCIDICVANPTKMIEENTEKIIETPINLPPQGKMIPCDIIEGDFGESNFVIYPNPTKNNWTLIINSQKEENIEINIVNIEGKQIYFSKETLKEGENKLILGNESYSNGTYILKVKGNTIDYSQKIIKE